MCNQSNRNHTLNVNCKRSRSNRLFHKTSNINSDLKSTLEQKRMKYSNKLRASADSTQSTIKNIENSINPSTDIYKRKIT